MTHTLSNPFGMVRHSAPRWMLPALWTDPRGVVAHRVSRPGDVAVV